MQSILCWNHERQLFWGLVVLAGYGLAFYLIFVFSDLSLFLPMVILD
jgi:hypothetical protein